MLKIICLLLSVETLVLSTNDSSKQPHIIVILADDLGFSDLSFRGSNLIPTPNIDALANAGLILNRHYVLPSCTPSRSAFLTGVHPIRLGTQGYPLKGGQPGGIPLGKKLLPEYLQELGYRTHMVGKWHVGYKTVNHLPTNRGFDSFLGYLNGYIDFYQLDYNQTLRDGGETFFGYDAHDEFGARFDLKGQYATDIFTEAAVGIIEKHKKDEPLFLYVSHLAAHTGTDEEGDGLQSPPGVQPDSAFDYIERRERQNYAAVVTSLDDSVGKILKALNDASLLDNSVILFMADNGAPTVAQDTPPNYGSNWPLRGVKFTLFEGGVRGAAVLWSKALPQSKMYESITHITDWLPTFVSIANGTAKGVDGVDQWKNFQEDKEVDNRSILLNIDEKENSEAVLLHGKWKVVKQNMRHYGNCDFHYKVQLNSPEVPEVLPKDIVNSDAGKALQGTGVTFNEEIMTNLRNLAEVKCNSSELHEIGWVAPSVDFLCKEYCVFNIVEDPCEQKLLDLPEIQKEGKILLDQWRLNLVPQNDEPVDERSDPINFGGVWSPWIRSYQARNLLTDDATGFICAATPVVLIVTGLLAKFAV